MTVFKSDVQSVRPSRGYSYTDAVAISCDTSLMNQHVRLLTQECVYTYK